MKHSPGKHSEGFPLALITALALTARLLGIRTRPIWYDEAFAILFSGKGPAAMLAGTLAPDAAGAAADIHPLGYYTLLWGWMKIFGEGLVSVRLLSVLLGTAVVILAYFLLKAVFGDLRLARLGALGAALSPFLVHYSQEIRMYSLLALSLTGATCALWQGLQSGRRRWWVLFAFCAALAQYSHNLAAFHLIPLALTPVLLRRWDKARMAFLAGLGALLLYLPWLLQLPQQLAKIRNAYWVEAPGPERIFTTLLSYVTNLPVEGVWLPLALAASLTAVTLAAYQTARALAARRPGARRGAWLAYLAFTPAALAFLVSQWFPIYIERALLPSAVMFWLWLAWALTSADMPQPVRLLKGVLLAAAILLGLAIHLTYAGFPYGPYAAIDEALRARSRPGDAIVHSNKLSLLPALYFDPALEQGFVADPPGGPTDTLAPATQAALGIQASPSLAAAVGDARRVHFVIFQQSLDEATEAGLETHPHIAWMEENLHLEQVERWGPLLLYTFRR